MRFWALGLAVLTVTTASAEPFRRANGNEPDTLDPQKYELVSENNILRDLFEGLASTDDQMRIVPGQAESWDVSDDGLVWTFHLREGVTWSDGVPITAADFVAGMQRAVDPATAAKMPDLTYKIENARRILDGEMTPDTLGVSAPDKRTVVVKLNSPSPLIPNIVASTLLVPVPRHVLEKFGDNWVKPGNMVTNGPYVLTKWEPSSEVKIARNPHYREADKVGIEEVSFFPSDDLEMALKRFRANEIDFVGIIPALKIPWAKAELPEALTLTPVNQVRYIEINHTLDKLKDPRVRRALALTIDREVITDKLMPGAGIAAYGFVPRAIEGYTGATFNFAEKRQAERVAEAKALLAEAGYGPSNPLTIDLRITSESWVKPVAAAITSMWQVAGIKATVNMAEAKVHYAAIDQGDYELAISGWFGADDPETFMWLYLTGGGLNESKYSSASFDAADAAAETTMDLAQRYEAFAKAERILLDDVAMIPLFWTVQAGLVARKIEGYRPTPRGFPRSRWATFGR